MHAVQSSEGIIFYWIYFPQSKTITSTIIIEHHDILQLIVHE